jgi:phosphatidylserine/phosphatidylglycerophosphate/cardiolipin synthase-like enzyme
MHLQYVSICRGGKSVLEKIAEAGIKPEDYISFFALRGYDRIHGHDNKEKSSSSSSDHIERMDPKQNFVTEEIYIHSKLMIVDDRFVICGSGLLKINLLTHVLDNNFLKIKKILYSKYK